MNTEAGKKTEEEVIKDAQEFLQLMRKSNDIWHKKPTLGLPSEWVFRGQRDAAWPLIPSIWRKGNQYTDLINRLKKNIDESVFDTDVNGEIVSCRDIHTENGKIASAWVHVERMLLHEFRRIAWLNAYPVHAPNGRGRLHDFKDQIPEIPYLFQGKYLQYESVNGRSVTWYTDPASDPDIALAQHYSIPTRMLDWTENPLTACFFAVEEFEKHKATDIAIWALNLSVISSLDFQIDGMDEPEPILEANFPDRRNNSFVKAQEGLLTSIHWRFVLSYFENYGEWPTVESAILYSIRELTFSGPFFDKYLPFNKDHFILKKLVLASDAVGEFKKLLQREGVTKEKVMPTLHNVSELAQENVRSYRPYFSTVVEKILNLKH